MTMQRRGFTLLETVTSLAILSSLAVVGTELLRTSLRVTHEAVAAQEMAARLSSAAGSLREDVWNAKAFSSNDNQSLHINPPQGSQINWSIDAGDLVREEGTEQRRWHGIGADSLFEIDGPSIILRSRNHDNREQMRLVSQLQLASREDR